MSSAASEVVMFPHKLTKYRDTLMDMWIIVFLMEIVATLEALQDAFPDLWGHCRGDERLPRFFASRLQTVSRLQFIM